MDVEICWELIDIVVFMVAIAVVVVDVVTGMGVDVAITVSLIMCIRCITINIVIVVRVTVVPISIRSDNRSSSRKHSLLETVIACFHLTNLTFETCNISTVIVFNYRHTTLDQDFEILKAWTTVIHWWGWCSCFLSRTINGIYDVSWWNV